MQQTNHQVQRGLLSTGFNSLLLALYLTNSVAIAQNSVSLAQIKQVELSKLADGKKTQLQIDKVDDARIALANDYRTTLKQNSNLNKYNRILAGTIASNKMTISSLQQQIESISNLERDIVPLISEMLDGLENFIALDIPFLKKERSRRVRDLKALISDGNVSNSEKYRRILEAYQIENDYGRTIEAYEGKLLQGGKAGEARSVTFLKVGRLVYLCQTLDKSESFRWSAKQKQWQRLDNSYNAQVDEGIKMAKEQIPSNLLFVPVEAYL